MGQQYEIIVKVEGLSSTKEDENKKKLKKTNNHVGDNFVEEEIKRLEKLHNAKLLLSTYVANKAIRTTVDSVRSYVSTIGARQDNVAKQNQVNNIMNAASSAVNAGLGIGNAAVFGSNVGTAITEAGGSISAGAGAAIAVAAFVVSEVTKAVIKITQNLHEYSRLQTQNSLESEKASERLGRIATNRNR